MAKERKKRQPAADPNETKADKFSRLASARVTKAVKAIRNIGNLATRSYEYTPAQAQAVVKYLEDAVVAVNGRFAAPSAGPAEAEIKI
jgi:hypothetical protein